MPGRDGRAQSGAGGMGRGEEGELGARRHLAATLERRRWRGEVGGRYLAAPYRLAFALAARPGHYSPLLARS